jgi:peptidoglycan L-alanyl-D-glutamate endopeptidase CwlK
MASRDPADLHPDLAALWAEFKSRCALLDIEVFLTCTYRSNTEQDADYAQGRTTPGHRITAAQAGQSAHNCTMNDDGVTPGARAFDFAIQLGDEGNELDWDSDDPQWQDAIKIGEALGLVSGKNFPTPDADHLELPNYRTYQTGTLSTKSAGVSA